VPDDEQSPIPPPLEAPDRRPMEWMRRVVGSPSDVVGQAGVRWRAAMDFAAAAPSDDGPDGWTPIGPRNVGGSVRSLAQDRDHTSTFYAGTSGGGLWRTTDDGNTWESLADAQIGAVPVCALAVAKSDRRVIWAGTGEAWQGSIPGVGLYRSVDGGGSFQKLADPGSSSDGDANRYTRIAVHPVDAKLAWVASDRGLWRFNDTSATQELNVGDYVTDVQLAEDPDDANKVILLAGVYGVGVRQGLYDKNSGTTTWLPLAQLKTTAGGNATNVGRVLVAIAPSNHRIAYALVHDRNANLGGTGTQRPQPLYASSNKGASFQQPGTAAVPAANFPNDTPSPQAHYSLALAVHPQNQNTVLAGHVNLYVSADGGVSWRITVMPDQGFMTWFNNLTFGSQAEHGDIHVIHFDRRDEGSNTPRVWVGNDGGLSFTGQWTVPGISLAPGVAVPPGPVPATVNFGWRKRSYGILGAQAIDVTTHPKFPSIVGIGMQDNATWFSYGGPTWYMVGQADGGALAFHPTDPRRAHISWQQAVGLLAINPAVVSLPWALRQPLPDVDTSGGLSNTLVADFQTLQVTGPGAAGQNTNVFRQLVTGDPTTPDRVVVAATNAAYLTTNASNGLAFTPLGTGGVVAGTPVGGFTAGPNPTETSAMAFVPGSANNRDLWIGTSEGDVFMPPTAAAPAPWRSARPFTANTGFNPWVACIAIHPAKPQVVAVCAYLASPALLISHDGGAHWFGADGSASTLPPISISALAWHPDDEKVLYAGTMVGVFVARDLPAFNAGSPATSANPTWKAFNRGLGPLLVNDLEVVQATSTLRAGTFSRGAFEASIRNTNGTYKTPAGFQVPPVKLSIRDHAFDDGRTYGAANAITTDVRLPVAGLPPTPPHMVGDQSIDIKVNAPEQRDRTFYLQSERFGHAPDGAELDEQFSSERPISGDTNVVYVQVNNRGWKKADNVQVFLYVGDASGGTAPALTGLGFPADPPPGHAWQLVASQSAPVLPGQPRVFRFEFVCPLRITTRAALFAICRSGDDDVTSMPAGAALAYATTERRAALRLVPVIPDRLFIRDGLDDTGQRGGVAWGGRSPDIIVMRTADAPADQAVADNPTTGPFANLNDPRRGDRVHTGSNTIFVRVHNRGSIPINARVNLFRVLTNQISSGAAWTPVAAAQDLTNIPPRGWLTARFVLAGIPADGVAGSTQDWQKAFIFAALVQARDPAAPGTDLESIPDVTTVTGVDEFWRLFTRGALANNAAFRALRFGGA